MTYMTDSDDVVAWFMETFEKIDDSEQVRSFHTDVWMRFQGSSVFSNLPPEKQTQFSSEKRTRKHLTTHVLLKNYYKAFECRRAVLGKHNVQNKLRHVFTNYRLRS